MPARLGRAVGWPAAVVAAALLVAVAIAVGYGGRSERATAAAPAAPVVAVAAEDAGLPGAAPRLGDAPAAQQPADAGSREAVARSGSGFVVDKAGRLVLDEQTRLKIEALVALTPPAQLRAAAQAEVAGLPATAAAQALELVERYELYQRAQKMSFAPGVAPLVPEQALAELDGLHALQVSHFGQATAQALFSADEAAARQLLELMRADTLPGLTMEQKAARAQAAVGAINNPPPTADTPR